MSEDVRWNEMVKSNSDQLNNIDLAAGPITVRVTGVRETNDPKQKLVIKLDGGHMPWKPCLTVRRIIYDVCNQTQGYQGSPKLVGRFVTLYRDPSVHFGKEKTGGIRLEAMSGIGTKPVTTGPIPTGRNKRARFTVKPLPDNPGRQGAATADLDALLTDAELTTADVDRWRAAQEPPRGPVAELNDQQRAEIAAWLGSDPARLDAIRALIPETS